MCFIALLTTILNLTFPFDLHRMLAIKLSRIVVCTPSASSMPSPSPCRFHSPIETKLMWSFNLQSQKNPHPKLCPETFLRLGCCWRIIMIVAQRICGQICTRLFNLATPKTKPPRTSATANEATSWGLSGWVMCMHDSWPPRRCGWMLKCDGGQWPWCSSHDRTKHTAGCGQLHGCGLVSQRWTGPLECLHVLQTK